MIKHVQKIEQVFDRIIIQRLESRKAHDYVITNDMLDTFLNISGVNSEDMDMTKLQHLLLILFTTGANTTSATLEWAMVELLRNPEKLSKAQQELGKIIGKGRPVEEGDIARPGQPGPLTSLIARLPYFQAIIKETFLLHPATPLPLPRKADSDFEICQLYFVNAWAIGRDPNIWDNPSLFVPERFLGLDDQIDVAGKNFELIPFSAGRRICPGLPWTMPILPLMLGSLINSFEWKLEDGVLPETLNMEEKFGLTLQMAHPLRAREYAERRTTKNDAYWSQQCFSGCLECA
ncbi:hypothetical protein L3X38_009789 [Prunus dulcis]|uniref:Uncharacterized protein n=1 Tax=Prunus dulcis TaxID=3755 RepID=A0AAD4WFX5_PRUDU|nr:hypothetical protein L3X38_009789 [Prunus dulcis]